MIKNVEMMFEYKNTILSTPQKSDEMYKQASSNDEVTISAWLEQWINNAKHTHNKFGSFAEHGLGKLYGTNKHKPCIVIGSGPSLKHNVADLASGHGITMVSCLHNYHYMVDNNVPVDYYVSLDAGPVVIEEITEGGKLSPEEYLESTKDKTLIAFIGSHPSLWESWRGKVILYNCPVAHSKYAEAIDEVERFRTYVSTGGNVLGACTYIARAILGSGPIIFTGADFCFSYTRKFHAWDSKYDANIGEAIRGIDVWGNGVLTWQSYYNFKVWFDWVACNVPGLYINCTEGGLMGSYPEGNIVQIKQMLLKDCLRMFNMYEEMKEQCENPKTELNKILF